MSQHCTDLNVTLHKLHVPAGSKAGPEQGSIKRINLVFM